MKRNFSSFTYSFNKLQTYTTGSQNTEETFYSLGLRINTRSLFYRIIFLTSTTKSSPFPWTPPVLFGSTPLLLLSDLGLGHHVNQKHPRVHKNTTTTPTVTFKYTYPDKNGVKRSRLFIPYTLCIECSTSVITTDFSSYESHL